jgi:hypothetical protein
MHGKLLDKGFGEAIRIFDTVEATKKIYVMIVTVYNAHYNCKMKA